MFYINTGLFFFFFQSYPCHIEISGLGIRILAAVMTYTTAAAIKPLPAAPQQELPMCLFMYVIVAIAKGVKLRT